jgi:hypothetical protein
MLLDIGLHAPTKDRSQEWADGLKDVIRDCRTKGLCDAPSVAKAVVEYRRQFLGDDSNILAIDQ